MIKPDSVPEPWYTTTLNVWTLAGVLVAVLALAKAAGQGWRLTFGRRRDLTRRLRKIAPGVRHGYVESLLGEPVWLSHTDVPLMAFVEPEKAGEHGSMKLTVRTWRLAWWGYLVTWSDDEMVLMYALTTTSWWFRPRILIHQIPIRLGKTPLAALGDAMGHRAWLGSRRFGYVEYHYFGNPDGYRDWYAGVNDIGYKAVAPATEAFVDGSELHGPLSPEGLAAYRARTPINTIVVSGAGIFEGLEVGAFFGMALGADQDVVRLTWPQYHVFDRRLGRLRRRLAARRRGTPAGDS
ncbi:ETEC_3214 domain-containing protein [Streptomyces nigra]|uniref:ETEC_3214 domain-containing protein n=1 Tax=Streptomyces nigra TaxID=1827580 RepID=UPI0037D1E59B